MFLTILVTLLTWTFIQILIIYPDKFLILLLYFSRFSFMTNLVPKFNQLLEFYNNKFNPILIPCSLNSNIERLNYNTNTKQFDELLKEYEEKNNIKIVFIHHGFTKSSFGLSFLSSQESLTLEDANKFIDTMRSIDENKTIGVILNTRGGTLLAAEIIINALLNHKGKIIVYIPYCAMSGGTLIALAANEIYMDKNACLGPIDPQINGFSAVQLEKYCKEFNSGSFIKDIVNLCHKRATAAIVRTRSEEHTSELQSPS